MTMTSNEVLLLLLFLSGECSQPGTEPGGGYSWTGNTFRESVPSQDLTITSNYYYYYYYYYY